MDYNNFKNINNRPPLPHEYTMGYGGVKGAPPDKLLPVSTAATRLGVSYRTIYRMIDAGDLWAVNISRGVKVRRYRVSENSINDFLVKNSWEW